MNQSFDVIIIGGGIVGLTAALAMEKEGFAVAVIDASTFETDLSKPCPRVYAISPASEHLMRDLNVWSLLDKQRLSPYRQMHVWDGQTKQAIDFDCRDIAATHLGTILEESLLKHALLAEISKTNVKLFPNCAVEDAIIPNAVRDLQMRSEISQCVRDDGRAFCGKQSIRIVSQKMVWECQLVMIADGAQSPLRQKLKVPLTSWSYQQNALVTTVQTQKPHLKTAYQVFNSDGPLAFLPLANPHQCSIVWSTQPQKVQELMAMKEDAFNQAIMKAFDKHLGETQLIGARHQFPLHMRHVTRYVGTSWMLLGDAAHTIHPLAGLGLNVGLADLRSWMNLLNSIKGDLTSAKRLGAYQRERKQALWQIILLMEGLKRVFGPSIGPISFIRSLGMRAVNEFGPLKRLLIEEACG